MKNLIYELNVGKILLILVVLAACFTLNPIAISVSVLSLVSFLATDRYLSIVAIKLNREDEFESVNKAIADLESKVSHLSNKDVAKDLMNGLSTSKR